MKIALIAMSGIRTCDEELMELGLNLPGFVERSKVVASLPSLGLLTLAGMTPEKHQVEYFEVSDIRRLESLPDGFDLVALSSFSAQVHEAYEIAQRYKEIGVPTVIGGLHVSCVPEEAAQYCDAVVIGQGELSWHTLLQDFESGQLKQFYGSRTSEYDLREAPMPAFELLDIPKYNRLTVQTSRGCPLQCEFCASSILITPKFKQKPAEKVLAEIDKILTIWPQPFIEFADDNTFVNRNYWKALLPELKKREIRWFTETDISVSRDPELLELMHESGCAQILIGLESPSAEELDGVELRANWKRDRCNDYKSAIKTIQSHGITVNGCFVLGLDNHGPDIFDQIYRYVEDTGLYEVQITVMTPFPGTPLYERLKREGRILEENAWQKCTLFDVNFKPRGMSVETLAKGLRSLGTKLYSEEFTKRRRANFRKQQHAHRQTTGGLS